MAGYFEISESLEMFDEDMEMMQYNEDDILSQIPAEVLDQLTPEMLEELQYQNPALFEQIVAASQQLDDRIFVLLDNYPAVIDQCLLPVIHNGVQIVLPLLLLIFLCKLFSTFLAKNYFTVNALNVLSGFAVLYYYSQVSVPFILFAVLLYSFVCYLCEAFSFKGRSRIVTLTYFFALSMCNLFIDAEMWHQAMGPQIILCMKILSLEFDLVSGKLKQEPSIDSLLGYLFHPGSVVFGPWVSYSEYEMTFLTLDLRSWLLCVLDAIKFALLSVLCLAYSNCFTNFLLGPGANIWLKAYFVAQGFRTSHYFVQYIASMTAAISGFANKPRNNHNHNSDNSQNQNCANSKTTNQSKSGNVDDAAKDNVDAAVSENGKYDSVFYVNPLGVEFPRSMGSIANNWNLFMNKWFKRYVFQQLLHNEAGRGNGNVFKAVIAVYLVSSLLHGAKFQVSAVLLTIGLISYAEYELRRKFSRIYSACIHSSPCDSNCNKHKYKWSNPLVLITNVMFALFNGFHLIYLGAPFDNSDLSSVGYSYQHTMAVWANLQYASHYAIFFIYALAKII